MIQRGEEINMGVGLEDARGTGVAPQVWIPGRTPSGVVPVVEKVALKETRGSKIASHGAEIIKSRAEGDHEFNLRVQSIGYLLKSLLGAVSSQAKNAPNGAVYDHTFSVLPNDPEHPSLTIGIAQSSGQDYKYSLGVVSNLSIEMTPDDLVKAVASFIASAEAEQSPPYVPAFSDDDVYFRHQDITIKMADDMSGLAAAAALKVKSMKIDIPNGGRADHNVSELNPGNVLATQLDPKVAFEVDYQNEDLHDSYTGGEYFALQITMERADITIGSNQHPKLVITFPKCSLSKWTPNRPIDDVVREQVEAMVHYDEDEAKPISVVLTNLLTGYEPAES